MKKKKEQEKGKKNKEQRKALFLLRFPAIGPLRQKKARKIFSASISERRSESLKGKDKKRKKTRKERKDKKRKKETKKNKPSIFWKYI